MCGRRVRAEGGGERGARVGGDVESKGPWVVRRLRCMAWVNFFALMYDSCNFILLLHILINSNLYIIFFLFLCIVLYLCCLSNRYVSFYSPLFICWVMLYLAETHGYLSFFCPLLSRFNQILVYLAYFSELHVSSYMF